jgi:HEAT repeat protein
MPTQQAHDSALATNFITLMLEVVILRVTLAAKTQSLCGSVDSISASLRNLERTGPIGRIEAMESGEFGHLESKIALLQMSAAIPRQERPLAQSVSELNRKLPGFQASARRLRDELRSLEDTADIKRGFSEIDSLWLDVVGHAAALPSEATSTIIRMFSESQVRELRHALINVLQLMGRKACSAVPELVACVRNDYPREESRFALIALGTIGSKAAISTLREVCESKKLFHFLHRSDGKYRYDKDARRKASKAIRKIEKLAQGQ